MPQPSTAYDRRRADCYVAVRQRDCGCWQFAVFDTEVHPYPCMVIYWDDCDGDERTALRDGLRALDRYAFESLTDDEQREHRRSQSDEARAEDRAQEGRAA